MNRFLTGLAAGVAIGFLTAPRSGKDTRQQLKAIAGEQTGPLKEQWGKTVSRAKEAFDNLKNRTGLFINQAKQLPIPYQTDGETQPPVASFNRPGDRRTRQTKTTRRQPD